MKTHRFYLKASKYFLSPSTFSNLGEEEKEYNYVASVLLSWMSLESYMNAICESLSKGARLKDHERLFLNEEQWMVDEEGTFRTAKIRPPTLRKMLFVLQYFSSIDIKDFKKDELWGKLQGFEDLRDKIVHHKETNDFEINQQKAIELRDLALKTIKYLGKLLTRTPKKKK